MGRGVSQSIGLRGEGKNRAFEELPTGPRKTHTNNEALHLVFSQDLNTESMFDLVVVFEGTAAGCHDAQFRGRESIPQVMSLLQPVHEVYAIVYILRFEFQKVETAT